jgi:hypothetical protein
VRTTATVNAQGGAPSGGECRRKARMTWPIVDRAGARRAAAAVAAAAPVAAALAAMRARHDPTTC